MNTLLRRLIIVAHDEEDLYDYIRRDLIGDESAKVIIDRRRAERRHQTQARFPDRRRGPERRRYDIADLLRTQGWAEVRSPESPDGSNRPSQ